MLEYPKDSTQGHYFQASGALSGDPYQLHHQYSNPGPQIGVKITLGLVQGFKNENPASGFSEPAAQADDVFGLDRPF